MDDVRHVRRRVVTFPVENWTDFSQLLTPVLVSQAIPELLGKMSVLLALVSKGKFTFKRIGHSLCFKPLALISRLVNEYDLNSSELI